MEAGPPLTAERLRSVLSYNQDTGKFTWICRRNMGGKIAGCLDARGYVVIRVDGKLYRAGRLAWLYVMGEWPSFQIDHKNLNRADDRWENLRSATNSQNSMNRTTPRANTTGVRGVYFNKKSNNWRAGITLNSKLIWLGSFPDRETARLAWVAAAEKLHGQFARAHD